MESSEFADRRGRGSGPWVAVGVEQRLQVEVSDSNSGITRTLTPRSRPRATTVTVTVTVHAVLEAGGAGRQAIVAGLGVAELWRVGLKLENGRNLVKFNQPGIARRQACSAETTRVTRSV